MFSFQKKYGFYTHGLLFYLSLYHLCDVLNSSNKNLISWLLFVLLAFVWGSSFILMKFGLLRFSAIQVAALRIVFSGLALLLVAIRCYTKIPRSKRFLVFMSGMLGSLLPAFLFCEAETGISSALAGTLNSLTPIFVIVIGGLFFGIKPSRARVLGIGVAFMGSLLLLLTRGIDGEQHLYNMGCVILATIMYGINVNIVTRHLGNIGSLEIAAVGLTAVAFPALAVLIFSGFFSLSFTEPEVLTALGASATLGVIGTAIATIMYYRLIKLTGPVFSSMVTYGIPVVALFWGFLYREPIGWKQVLCLVIILAGVFIANMEMIFTATRNRFNRS